MPSPNSDPDQYSLDEMMERLKKRRSPENSPELVTREDGSQAMKVRKRKRRTNQTANKAAKINRRVHMFQIGAAAFLLIFIGLIFGVGIVFANSTGFRKALVQKLAAASGAKVQLAQFRMNPIAANANAATLHWPESHILDNLQLNPVSAKISPSSFLGNVFAGEEIVAVTGKILLKSPGDRGFGSASSHPLQTSQVRFPRIAVSALDASFGSLGSLSKVESSLYPRQKPEASEIRLTGGKLLLSGWPPLNHARSFMKWEAQHLVISTIRLEMPEAANRKTANGAIEFTGTMLPSETSEAQFLAAKVEGFSLAYLLGADLGRILSGRVDTTEITEDNYLGFLLGDANSSNLSLKLISAVDSRIDLTQFQFLKLLSTTLEDRWYEFPTFKDEVRMDYSRKGERIEVKNLYLEQRGRLVISGNLSNAEGGAILGKLKVGVPEGMIKATENQKLAKMFQSESAGYLWVELEISGTSSNPIDNFRSIYMDDSAGSKIKTPKIEPSGQDSFESLLGN